jgi:phospholipase C
MVAPPVVRRVIVLVQENHTTDNYFRALRAYGANVATHWPTSPNPPHGDQPHDRHAYFAWLTSGKAARLQFASRTHLRFYVYLALTGAFLENHCSGFGTNSTPNHLLLVGGQSPTLRNPPRGAPPPVWDLPSVPGLAEDNGIDWRCYTAGDQYPVGFYAQLRTLSRVVPAAQFAADAAAGRLPPLVYLWSTKPATEHPPEDVTVGMNHVWQAVDAVVRAGAWNETAFMLTYDDWGGYDDHVRPPATEYTPDNVQLALGPRVPLIMFGGCVESGIDSRWCSHASIAKTAIQLLGLPPLGVPRVDDDAGLADLVRTSPATPPPPAFGRPIPLPRLPLPAPRPAPLPPPPAGAPIPVPPVILRSGGTLSPPNDVPLPKQPRPPR